MNITTDISVIMSAHNAEKTLNMAIRSTLFALPESSELLVCLHKCSDNSLQIAESIKDDRLKVHVLDEGGFADALNYLIGEAKGHWLARMDADDICLPWRFRLQMKEMRRDPGIDLLFGTAIIFGESIRPFWIFPQYLTQLNSEAFSFLLALGNPGVHPTLFAKREILARSPYRDVPGEDLDLWLRLSAEGKRLERDRNPVLLYRSHFAQMSRRTTYLNGWQNSDEIKKLRTLLPDSSLSALYTTSRLRFALFHPLLALELIGLPRPSNIVQWFSSK